MVKHANDDNNLMSVCQCCKYGKKTVAFAKTLPHEE